MEPGGSWDATLDSDALLNELLDETTNETDELLTELLADGPKPAPWILADHSTQRVPSNGTSPPPSTNTPLTHTRQQPCGRDSRTMTRTDKAKHTLESLRLDVSQLTTRLKRLQSECNIPETQVRKAMEAATVERLKRRRVEDECRQLREAVYKQAQFLRGLRSVLSTPSASSAMDLTHYLHSYTRLPRGRSMRWSEYAVLAQEARFQSALDILCRETQKMSMVDARPSVDTPYIHTEVLDHTVSSGGFGVTSTSVFALTTNDLSVALRGVCVTMREMPTRAPAYECFGRKKMLVDADASLPVAANGSSIAYRVMGVDHKLDHGPLAVESHNVTLYKQTEDFALLLEDFVDHDELHPQDEATNVTRQAVGACLVRREICDDGVERAVCRVMRTRHYRFHEHTSPAVLQRFQQLLSATLHANELLLRQLINESIAQEEHAYTEALHRLQALE